MLYLPIDDNASSKSDVLGSRVAVLLGTLNGAEFLGEQLESIERQSATCWQLVVSDDGSQDGTQECLSAFRHRAGEDRVSITSGPGRGYVANFLSLVQRPTNADYFAFADQDDVWDADKLQRAVCFLSSLPPDRPALYCSRTRLIDEQGRPAGLSARFTRPPGFANALIQNIAGGNTMVFNRAARELLVAFGDVDVVSHDWWVYLVISACGGEIFYDPEPSLDYRQHRGNQIGSSQHLSDRWNRLLLGLRGRKRDWNARHIAALNQMSTLLTDDSRRVLSEFCHARHAGLWGRIIGMRRAGVYAQSVPGNIGLFVATILNIL